MFTLGGCAVYYECHITIEPVLDHRLEAVETLAKKQNFKLAKLLMHKREEDTLERSKYDTFMTGHADATHEGFSGLSFRMVKLIDELRQADFKVYRYKIEHILTDSRIHDSYELLN